MVDEFQEPPRGRLIIDDKDVGNATKVEMKSLPIYSICGADLVELRPTERLQDRASK
jgi:hypothetical protein